MLITQYLVKGALRETMKIIRKSEAALLSQDGLHYRFFWLSLSWCSFLRVLFLLRNQALLCIFQITCEENKSKHQKARVDAKRTMKPPKIFPQMTLQELPTTLRLCPAPEHLGITRSQSKPWLFPTAKAIPCRHWHRHRKGKQLLHTHSTGQWQSWNVSKSQIPELWSNTPDTKPHVRADARWQQEQPAQDVPSLGGEEHRVEKGSIFHYNIIPRHF